MLAAALGLLGLTPVHASTFSLTTIHTFTPATDGNVTYAPLVQGADGKLYGTNSASGKSSNGTVFTLDLTGNHFAVLCAFSNTSDGTVPEGGLVQARDGNFYGTTYSGGSNGFGILYQVTTAATHTDLGSFNNGDPGANPVGTLVEGLDGYLYGTARYGGTDNFGTVYRANVPTTAVSTVIDPIAEITGALAGSYPESDLIQGVDGYFYGTTLSGGTSGNGTFFRVSVDGVYTVLYSFTGDTDGGSPLRGVVEDGAGYFYGVTTTGGAFDSGTIYQIIVSGTTVTFNLLYTFDPLLGDGSTPDGNLLLATDGNFYGTTAMGGANEEGTIYRITPSGAFATLYNFADGTDGAYPVAGLTEGSDGRLYGTTAGMNGSSGTVFQVDLGLALPPPVAAYALQTSALVGDTILIKGNYFVGTTGVLFTGSANTTTAATSVDAISKTIVRVVVPSGAVTGPITVTTAGGSSTTALSLTVISGSVSPTPTPATPTPTPVPTPVVTVVAADPVATRTGGNNGTYNVVRSGDRSQALTVLFKTKGTAVRGTDYNLSTEGETLAAVTNSVTIPAGAKKLKVKVVPVVSSVPGPDETVVLQIKAGAGYEVSSPKKAVVEIAGNTGGS